MDANQRFKMTGQLHPAILTAVDQGALAANTEISYAVLLLRPALGLEAFLADQQDPSSPEYRKWLTPEQFADRFGVSANDAAKVSGWLRSQGLQVHDVARGRHWISFSGTAVNMTRALHTPFHRYLVNGESHFSNTTDPEIPAAIAGVAAGFLGLNDLDPAPAAVLKAATPKSNLGGFHYLVPDDVATIYDITPLYQAGIDGSGQKIAVVGRADLSLTDVRSFRRRFNLPAKDPQIVLVGPDPGTTDTAAVGEALLDVEWSGAVAPNATIVYVNSRSVNTSVLYAIDGNLAPVLSESYGSCELAAQPGFRAIAQQASAQGITWVVSSGDTGAATCDRSNPNLEVSKGYTADFPASIPEITAVGGTAFNEGSGVYWASANGPNQGSALSYIPEMAMNDSGALHFPFSSGGGASALFPKPAWQRGPGVPNDQARDVPDVAMPSSLDHDPVEAIVGGTLVIFGGTSVGAPMFAAITALLNHYLVANKTIATAGVGNINPTLYRLAQSTTDVFHDVTAGNTNLPCMQQSPDCVDGALGHAAGPGYDLATGLGSVDVNKMITRWTIGTSSVTTLTANPTTFSPADKIQLTATVTGSGVAPTGTVTFISNDLPVGSAALSGGSVSVMADGLLIAGGSGKITAQYSGDSVYNASGASVNVTLKLPASGSLVIPTVTPNPVTKSYNVWPYTVRLDEKAGVATRLTAFTINGTNNLSAFPNTTIPALGSISASLAGANLTVPLDRVYHFAGTDADGRNWTQDLTVPFTGPPAADFTPSIRLSSVPAAIENNPQAASSCVWSQQLVVEETSGFYHLLQQFVVGTTDISSLIVPLFGTDRLGPYGTLFGTVCWTSASAAGQAKNYQILGVSEVNSAAVASVNTTLASPAANPASFSASPRIVEMLSDGAARTGSGTVNLKFNANSPRWTASIFPARAAQWLTVTPLSGSGTAQVTLQASGAALSNGVYDATVVIQAAGAIPQTSNVRVVFAVGSSYTTVIDSISNAATRNPSGAPGAMIDIRGSNLAQRSMAGTLVEDALPVSLDGVSVTINGVTAPLYSIAPGKVTVQIPYETALGPAVVGVNNHGQIAPFIFDVSILAPELFRTSPGFLSPTSTARQGQTIAAFMTGDGDATPFIPTGVSPPAGTKPSNLPGPLFSVVVTVGGVHAPVSFYGITPGLVGVTQINFTVPATVRVGVQPVVVTVGGVSSAAASINVTK